MLDSIAAALYGDSGRWQARRGYVMMCFSWIASCEESKVYPLGECMMTAIDAVEDSGAVGSPGKRVGRRGRIKTALPVRGERVSELPKREKVEIERPCSEDREEMGRWLGGWEMGGS